LGKNNWRALVVVLADQLRQVLSVLRILLLIHGLQERVDDDGATIDHFFHVAWLLVLLQERLELGIVEPVHNRGEKLQSLRCQQFFLKINLLVDGAEHKEQEVKPTLGDQ
jgi:hypothetical protein